MLVWWQCVNLMRNPNSFFKVDCCWYISCCFGVTLGVSLCITQKLFRFLELSKHFREILLDQKNLVLKGKLIQQKKFRKLLNLKIRFDTHLKWIRFWKWTWCEVTKCWNLHVDTFNNNKYKFLVKLHYVF